MPSASYPFISCSLNIDDQDLNRVQGERVQKHAALLIISQYDKRLGGHTRWPRTFFAILQSDAHSPLFSESLETSNRHSTTLTKTPRQKAKLAAPFPPAAGVLCRSQRACLSRSVCPVLTDQLHELETGGLCFERTTSGPVR